MMNDSEPLTLALHEQRDWLRVTLASIGDAVITTDTDGLVTFLNTTAESLTGWSLDAATGLPLERVFRIINQDTRRTVESPSVRALRDGVIVGLANHTLLIARDGTERPIDDSAAPIRDAKDKVAGVVLVFRDISERYRQDRAILDALAFAENIIATLRHPFLVLDRDLRIRTANRAFYDNFRVTPGETVGRSLFDLGQRQWDLPDLRELLATIGTDIEPVHDFGVESDFPAIGKRSMLLNARRIRKDDGETDLILLAIEDVTDLRRSQAAMQISEARYRRLFETAKDGILILDAGTLLIIDSNPFMSDLLGYARSEFVGKELWEIGVFADKAASQAMYEDLQRVGYIRYDHLPLQSTDGRKVEVEFISNVYRVDNRLVAQCNVRDITERSRLEQKSAQQAEALADLHRRKDEFLAMLSHELRNPLAPILNAVQLLRLQANEDPFQQSARTIIERQVGQLTRLVDDLLEISRISTGRIHLRLERISVGGIVEQAVETVRPLIEQRRHALKVSLPTEPLWIQGDGSRIEQVVVNLLTNAAKYTDDGGSIAVTLDSDNGEAVLRVRDSGVGIAPELLPRIFELFTQAERSLDRSQGGLGIGLSLVHRLVDMHGGRVEVSSTLGLGSEFVVRLPMVPMDISQVELNKRPQSPDTIPLRVLVVDDNRDAAQSLAMLLSALGHDVKTGFDGPGVEALAREFRPDVILLDIGLPRMDGLAVAAKLRSQPEFAGVTLVAVTGYGQDSDRVRSIDAGFDHHLVKPARLDALQEILAAARPASGS